MFSYLEVIICRILPISLLEDKLFPDFSKFEERISRKALKKVMFALVELVEGRISAEMRQTKGAIMHDGWSDSGAHYIGIMTV